MGLLSYFKILILMEINIWNGQNLRNILLMLLLEKRKPNFLMVLFLFGTKYSHVF